MERGWWQIAELGLQCFSYLARFGELFKLLGRDLIKIFFSQYGANLLDPFVLVKGKDCNQKVN
jgi:hypothetical protein